MEASLANVKITSLIGGAATAAVLGYASLGGYTDSYIPTESYAEQVDCCVPENSFQDTYYRLIQNDISIEDQVISIHNCVSNLLENTKDLDPRISKLIDEHFWELG